MLEVFFQVFPFYTLHFTLYTQFARDRRFNTPTGKGVL